MKSKQITLIEAIDWEELVIETYKRPYATGGVALGLMLLTVPVLDAKDHDAEATTAEEAKEGELGIKFDKWLELTPYTPINGITGEYKIELFWEKVLYPDVRMLANDLYSKGLLKEGTYGIHVDY